MKVLTRTDRYSPVVPSSASRRLAILGFHKIGAPPMGAATTPYYIPEAVFERFLRHLQQSGWTVINVATLLESLADTDGLPDRMALLTFDDGYRSFRHIVLPVLRRFNFPAVLFVPTDHIGGYNSFDVGIEPIEPICTWEDLKALERDGVSVQSHGASHQTFSTLAARELEDEMRSSKDRLEKELNKSVELLAYPYGDDGVDANLARGLLKRTGYKAAFLFGGDPIRVPIRDPFLLPRLAMYPEGDIRRMLRKGTEELGGEHE